MTVYTALYKSKAINTPQGRPLEVPTEALADAISKEWDQAATGGKVNPLTLALTPLACVAIDLARDNREAMLADIIPYIDTDLVCYRSAEVPLLHQQQDEVFQPLIAWVRSRFGITLNFSDSVMPVKQPSANRRLLLEQVMAWDEWKCAAFATATKPLGSVVLALALVEGEIGAEDAFRFAHLEESYETAQWGMDDEKERHLNEKRREIASIEKFLELLSAP